MPRGVHPNTLANLKPWDHQSAFENSIKGVMVRTLNRTLNNPESISADPALAAVRRQLHSVRIRIAKAATAVTLDKLTRVQERLMREERRLTGEKVDRPAARTERKPVAPLPKPLKPDAP